METYTKSDNSLKSIESAGNSDDTIIEENSTKKPETTPFSQHKIKFNFRLYIFILLFYVTIFMASYTNLAYPDDEMDFEEFMGMMSETFTDEQLDEMSYLLPWEIKVLAYGYGDFSGDGKIDIAFSITEKNVTPKNSVDVYFLENIGQNKYRLVKKKNVKWIELAIEIAFLVKDGQCFITSRDADNWYFTSYRIKKEKLVLVNKEIYPIINDKLGN